MKNKKNAFTLIELLAVIVILAIIALIATPIILGIIEDAKRDAFLRSVELVVSTTDLDVSNKTYEEKYTYTIEDGNIPDLEIGVKNTEGMNGKIVYDTNGNSEYAISNGVYCVRKLNNMETVEIKTYEEGMCIIPEELTEENLGTLTFNDLSYTYDGTEKKIEVNNLPEGFTVKYENNTGTNAGVYNAKAIITGDNNYSGSITKTATLTINKAQVTITAEDKNSLYGEELVELTYKITSGTIYGNDNLNITLTKEDGTATGEYDIIVTAENENYEITKVNGKYTIEEEIPIFTNGQRVYFDVEAGTGCTMERYASSHNGTDFQNSLTGYNGYNGTEIQNSCLLFYAFNDDGGESINLILDHNTTGVTYWTNSSTSSSANGPITVLSELKTATSNWNGTIIPENYTVTQTGYGNYPIPYKTEEYRARLITAQEVAQITGADKKEGLMFNESTTRYSKYFYFDSLGTSSSSTCKSGNTTGCQYGWLYDRTGTDCITYGCYNNADSGMTVFGYWTGTSAFGDSYRAWLVDRLGYLYNYRVTYGTYYGVRPVITVLKSKVSPGVAPVIPE